MDTPTIDQAGTEKLSARIATIEDQAGDPFAAALQTVRHLGAIPREDGTVAVALWTPQLVHEQAADADVHLELLTPTHPIDLTVARATVTLSRHLVDMRRHGPLTLAVVRGATIGTRTQVGSFYSITYQSRNGEWHRIIDPLATSMPYGAFAPPEIYALQTERRDQAYWRGLADQATPDRVGDVPLVRQRPASNILQVHVPTATAGGTLASLARWYDEIGRAVAAGHDLTPHQQAFVGYDAVQLLPVEPTTVHEAGPPFWDFVDVSDDQVTVELHRPDTTNWGYDVVIAGGAAVNPTVLESGRPDELADLAAVLHTLPGGPIRLIADVVYGHSDNQGLDVLDTEWLAGPNMYGQDLDFRNPWVRAHLLEMQRRKVNYGFDGVRVDGAQDFKYFDPEANQAFHDDEFLQQMSDVVQQVAGCTYRPWMIFEDGRPWPQPDWELASTYRAVIDAQADDDVFQWGPLTFAHNTPFLVGFWLRSWWRIRQILDHGADWISGCANHDTLRRGTQVSPELYVNQRLGSTLLEILDKAYDNPAITMLTYTCLPGVPMDFINASMRAAWGFIRNTDDRYGVKVVSEEAISLGWQVDHEAYALPASFRRLKSMGFETLEQLRRFTDVLPALVDVTAYDLQVMARLLDTVDPPLAGPEHWSPDVLKVFARAWMDDMHDYASVDRWASRLSGRQTGYNLACREFRRTRPWLRGNLTGRDHFHYLQPVDGHVVFVSLRHAADGGEQVLTVVNMEGSDVDLVPTELDVPGLDGDGWYLQLRTPNIGGDYLGGPITLNDSSGVVFTRDRG